MIIAAGVCSSARPRDTLDRAACLDALYELELASAPHLGLDAQLRVEAAAPAAATI